MSRRNARLVIVLLVTVLVLGAGVACAIGVLRGHRSSADSTPRLAVASLWIEENTDPQRAESEEEGHRDLRFENRADDPTTVRLLETDCQCAHVLIGMAPQTWRELSPEEIHKRADDSALVWHTLQPGGKELTLPPRSHGLVRMTWNTKTVGDHVFWADLFVAEGDDRGPRRIEVPVQLVEIVRLHAEDDPNGKEIDVGPLDAGEKGRANFVACSLTRDRFTLVPAPAVEDPCLVYGSPQALSRGELRALSDKTGSTLRSGYRLTVTMKEHAGDRRLDLGPFHRRVVWKTNVSSDHRLSSFVNGTVRGEVSLVSPEDKPFIDLGTIRPTAPQSVIFTLRSRDPRIRLTVDEERSLSLLCVELLDGEDGKTEQNGKTWRVRVAFRKDALFRGFFPDEARPGFDSAPVCSIVFRISRSGTAGAPAEQPPRRLLIPVRGTVRNY
jgi:hypothetical protein